MALSVRTERRKWPEGKRVRDWGLCNRAQRESPEHAEGRRKGRRFTFAEARDERVKARALVIQRINPVHHRQQERVERGLEKALTFEAVAKEWLSLKEREETTKTRRINLKPRFRSRYIAHLRPGFRFIYNRF